ncbi:MAG: hypothetical protein AB9842_10020 [Bacteroidales bacterium]
MELDIRIPIGFMFSILGLILTLLGIITYGDSQMYLKSLSININLWTGLLMLVFGVLMLLFALKKRRRKL